MAGDVASRRSVSLALGLALAGLFLFRLLFGLTRGFFLEDESQIFLIGLRYYATGQWPYFGPDVTWTDSEIPGALQGLLIGLPLKVWPVPEAPIVLLVLLSTGALACLARYAEIRLPSVPRWLIYGWFLTAPWTLHLSTHLINPSYVLPASVAFFIGFFESVPRLRIGWIRRSTAFFLMGAATTWIMQIHMSWPLLLPYAAFAWLSARDRRLIGRAADAAVFGAGAVLPALVLIPTIVVFHGSAALTGTARNFALHWVSPWVFVRRVAQFLSFASLEIGRFFGADNAKRLMFFDEHRWLVPFAGIAWLAGIVQPIWMLVEWFRRGRVRADWWVLKWAVAASVLLVYVSYWLVMQPPQARAYYLLLPLALMFAAYCWSFVDGPRARIVAGAALAANIALHAGQAWVQAPQQSLYSNRVPVAEAIRLKEPELFAHRRAFAIEGGPVRLSDPSRPYDPIHDIEVMVATPTVASRRALQWTVRIRNVNPRVAFRDQFYVTTSRDASGRVIDERRECIREIFEPGDTRSIQFTDGFAPTGYSSATFRITGAEALLPVPSRGR